MKIIFIIELIILSIALIILAIVLWIWAFIDIKKETFKKLSLKKISVFFLLLLPIMGPILYFSLKEEICTHETLLNEINNL